MAEINLSDAEYIDIGIKHIVKVIENFDYEKSEKKYKYVDRIVDYVEASTYKTRRGDAYQRLLFASILSISPVDNKIAEHVKSYIRAAQVRIIEGDGYNTRLLVEKAIDLMERNKL